MWAVGPRRRDHATARDRGGVSQKRSKTFDFGTARTPPTSYLRIAADLNAAASSDTSGQPDKLPEAERYTRHATAGSAPAAGSTSTPFKKNDGDPLNPHAFACSSEAIVMVSTDSPAGRIEIRWSPTVVMDNDDYP
jgi:hypothetical protein